MITVRTLPRELVEMKADAAADDEDSPLSLDLVERDHIAKVLAFFDGNRQRAAQALGIGRKTLYRKIQKHNILDN